jgi:hypothetical protein
MTTVDLEPVFFFLRRFPMSVIEQLTEYLQVRPGTVV